MNDDKVKKLTIILSGIYLIALFWIIVLKFNISFSYMGDMRRINLIPFSEPLILNGKPNFSELILNVVIFVPLGIYTGSLFRRWATGKKFFLFFLISFLCEGFQFVLAIGAFDITDIINNTLGGLIGLMIYKGVEKVFNDGVKAQKFINIIALIGTVSIILMILLLKINRLWIFRMES